MDGNEFVRKLVAGSEAIDRMRHEIDLVVKSILGLLDPADFQHFMEKRGNLNCLLTISVDAINWNLTWVSEANGNEMCAGATQAGSNRYVYTSWAGKSKILLSDVQLVHATLPSFVSEVTRHFPQLNDALKPLLNAADAK